MIYLFKDDLWGNKVPAFAAQTDKAATAYANASRDELYSFHTKGNMATILNL